MMQRLKDRLVKWGPRNPVTQAALRLALFRHGFRVGFERCAISLYKDGRTILMRPEDLSLVPVVCEMHAHFFQVLEADGGDGADTIDFTKPALHKYRRTGLTLTAPTVAEDDSMPQYTLRFVPTQGMTVFDVGAHAGLTTLELSKMVGPAGRVYAFEPDEEACRFLRMNIDRHHATNVTVIDAALGEKSGEALFSMDGTQAAGLIDSLVYSREDRQKKVRVMTLREACEHVGAVPSYIKSDIEGAELGMIRGSLDFLRNNPINLAFETHRLRDGTFTHEGLEPLLSSVGYRVEHLVQGPTHFMYATPSRTTQLQAGGA